MLVQAAQKVVNKVWALGRRTNEPRYPDSTRIPYTGRTQAGVFVTPDRALMNDTIWAAHRYLTQTVAQLPARIIQRTSNSNQTILNHPVDKLLNWRPNPELSPFQFKETLTGWAIMHGNGVAEIERNGFGSAINLWPIHPDRLLFLRDIDTQELIYCVDQGTEGTIDLAPSDVFHLRGFGNGAVGLSVVEYAAQSIGWARATELFGASFFGEGMHFGGVVSYKQTMDKDTKLSVREELDQTHRGPNRSGKWFITDGDASITKMTATPDEAQFVATMQHQVESICRWMGVPPHKVHHLLRMTYNNVEQMSIDVVGDSIVPWAMRLEQEATYKLFGLNRNNLNVVFEVKGLLRGDYKSRQEGLQIQRRNGVINADDWADLEDIPKPKNGGEVYIVEKNMVTMEQLVNPPIPTSTQQTNQQPAQNDNAALAALIETDMILNETINA